MINGIPSEPTERDWMLCIRAGVISVALHRTSLYTTATSLDVLTSPSGELSA
ncbi:uncharacterized protein ACLA_055080 [Aspergillus clavatus NRRL 1]|uniref:Uncharacterized protein n=1 Tax=Aspergillus clavatus (strain ATCC 1007 / CBS 513.65 / DSM 816 / NCTC 3887 / NRRL 1 / QM 1276 / 107) TaxID=344612 RepID=A1C9D7_ASPCL|nr:uncharacterized protein ACLA_055080 [Aspergillus clavatus NRRL 1]EAW13461.1 hypothetical protein ACLA_055080 [Aspergillus clavatus NRRL 1]